jgi:hypothetical protein
LNRALDNTEFHSIDDDDDVKINMIMEIIQNDFNVWEKQDMEDFINNIIFGESLRGGLLDKLYDNYVIDMDGGDVSPMQQCELEDLQVKLSKWIMNHILENGGRIKMDGKDAMEKLNEKESK